MFFSLYFFNPSLAIGFTISSDYDGALKKLSHLNADIIVSKTLVFVTQQMRFLFFSFLSGKEIFEFQTMYFDDVRELEKKKNVRESQRSKLRNVKRVRWSAVRLNYHKSNSQ